MAYRPIPTNPAWEEQGPKGGGETTGGRTAVHFDEEDEVKTVSVAILLVMAMAMLCLAGSPALATKTVSTSDGVSLNFTDTGAFSSMTVNGNSVSLLNGVSGGFYIVPLDGVQPPGGWCRHDWGAGSGAVQITGTATQSGNTVTITGSASNESFNIVLTGGLPYIKVDGTVTGSTQNDHVFQVEFRLPVNAQDWVWGNTMVEPKAITSDTSKWYDFLYCFGGSSSSSHPMLSNNHFGSISSTASPAMGISMSPLVYPPSAHVLDYNLLGGFRILFELGTTTKTTLHSNTADFHFVIYQHNPTYGNHASVARYQSFFPEWFVRRYPGGNFADDDNLGGPSGTNALTADLCVRYIDSAYWANAYTSLSTLGIYDCKYQEPWSAHNTWLGQLNPVNGSQAIEEMAKDVASNDNGSNPGKGETSKTWARP